MNFRPTNSFFSSVCNSFILFYNNCQLDEVSGQSKVWDVLLLFGSITKTVLEREAEINLKSSLLTILSRALHSVITLKRECTFPTLTVNKFLEPFCERCCHFN